MKLSELTTGTHIRAQGRTWAITLIEPQADGDLKLYLSAAGDDDDPVLAYDTANLHGKPDTQVEVVATSVTLVCPLCVDAQIEEDDHIEEVTAPTREMARRLLVDHILDTNDDVAHDDVNVVEYLVKNQT